MQCDMSWRYVGICKASFTLELSSYHEQEWQQMPSNPLCNTWMPMHTMLTGSFLCQDFFVLIVSDG